MRTIAAVAIVTIVVALSTASAPSSQGNNASAASNEAHSLDQAKMDRWKKDLNNWGRWGADDQKGALNLITPAKRKQAAALVTEGFPVSMAREELPEKAPDNQSPYEQVFRDTDIASYDTLSVNYHGLAHTHYDALAHHFYSDGSMYNGFKHKEFFTLPEGGATKNSVINVKDGVFTRGILIDIPRLKGVPYLEPGTSVYIEDIEAWEKQAGIKVGPGDALFIRVGRWARQAKLGAANVGNGTAGVDGTLIPWLKQRDVAIIGTEAAVNPTPRSPLQTTTVPEDNQAVHNFALVALGMGVIDNCDFEALSEAAAARKRWAFLVTIAPLPMIRGTGSPINPIAIF